MNQKIKITFLANAGIIVDYEQKSFIIDGLYHTSITGFSNLLPEQLTAFKTGTGTMGKADYLLFTHAHEDHFSANLTAEYLKNGSSNEKYVLLPPGIRPQDAETIARASEESGHCRVVSAGKDSEFHILAFDLRLELLPVVHMGEAYREVQNNCLLLTLGDKHLLFTGDAEPDLEAFQKGVGGRMLSAVFVNPLFYHDPKGWRVIEDVLKPEVVVIYHLAFSDQDKYRLGKMARKDLAQREGRPFDTILLDEKNQSFYL